MQKLIGRLTTLPTKLFFILWLPLVFISNKALSQNFVCGSPITSSNVTPNNNPPTGPLFVKTYLHVIRKSDKSGGLSESDIKSILPLLNSNFNPHGFYFSLACVNFIDNSPLYFNEGQILNSAISPSSSYFRSDGLNIFLIPYNVPKNDAFSGLAAGIPSQSLYIYYQQNDRNIVHEVGHCFGLFHTFHGTCAENGIPAYAEANCSTCSTNGDLVADTPGDDGVYNSIPNCNEGTQTTNCNGGCCDPNGSLYIHTNPKNIMSYGGNTCWEYFTPGQATRMKSLILNAMLLQNPSIILQNTTWSGTVEMTTDLTIKAPYSLTIDGGTLKMSPGRKIIIEGNTPSANKASLYVTGASIITKNTTPGVESCNEESGSGVLWDGIIIENGTSVGGYLSINGNSTIEYARKAIRLAKYTPGLKHGRVFVNSATFLNNNLSLFIELDDLPSSYGGNVSFRNSTFKRTDAYVESIFDSNHKPLFDGHIRLRLAPTINSFFNCKFLDENIESSKQATNITSFSSDLRVGSKSEVRNTKQGFVISGTNYIGGITIDDSDFYGQTQYGINVSGGEPTITNNRFHNEEYASSINMISTSTFSVKGNNFYNGIGGFIHRGASKTIPTTIFRNLFTGQTNSASLASDNNYGVVYRCNNYDNSQFNIINNGSLNPIQGSKQRPAGNVFLNTSLSDFSNSGPTLNYFYDKNAVNEEPKNTSGISKTSTDYTSKCNEIGITMSPQEAESEYQTQKTAHTQLKQNLASLLDGGNTPYWVQAVQNANNQNANSVKNQLLALSPYLSNQVIKNFLIRTDIYTNAERISMITSNSHILLDVEMVDFLLSGSAVLSPQDLHNIPIANTQRLADESEINYRLFAWNYAISEALRNNYLSDTIDFPTIRMWLARRNCFDGYMQLADSYLFDGSYNQWLTAIDNVPNQVSMSTEQQAEWNYYKSMYVILGQAKTNGRNLKQLTQNELNALNAIATSNNYKSNQYAKSFLTEFYNYSFSNNNGQKVKGNVSVADENKEQKLESQFLIYPNPANGQINIEIEDQNIDQKMEVKIFDILGKLVQTVSFQSNKINTIDVKNLVKGYYQIQIITPNNKMSSSILINK